MKFYLILFFLLFIFSEGYGQIDVGNTKRSEKHIGPENRTIQSGSQGLNPERRIDKGFSLEPKSKILLGQPDDPVLDVNPNKSKALDMTEESEYITRTIKLKPGYLEGSRGRDGEIYKEFSKPQDFGSYRTSGDFVTVSWRDSQVVDGDRVDIMVNGEVVVHNVTLLARYHSIKVPLEEGFTKIEFKALNMGESGPNTADFKVEDANGRLMVHDEWNLTTGVVAHLLVIKENE